MAVTWQIGGKTVQSLTIGGKEVQQIKRISDNVVLYEKQGGQDNYALSLTGDKSILSYVDNESCILTATVTNNGIASAGKSVVFKKGNTVLNTVTTNSNGIAQYTYNSQAVGDITITAECMSLSETYSIQDHVFYRTDEISKTTSTSMIKGELYSGLSLPSLPNKFVWECDLKVSSQSSSEDRVVLTPTNFSGEQNPYGIFIQLASSSNGASFGIRRNGGTYGNGQKISYSADTYVHFKIVRDGSTIHGYVDNTDLGTMTETWLDDYNTWWFSYSFWKRPRITGTIRNMKLKAL